MFRGSGIVILTHWLLTLNVYVWNKFYINYKLVFGFKNHFSTVQELLKRSAIFSAIFLLMFLWCINSNSRGFILEPYLKWMPAEYTPLIIWLFLFVYLIFPSKNHFNFKGRLYFFKLLWATILSPFRKTSF